MVGICLKETAFLYSYQAHMKAPFAPYLHQQLMLSVFYVLPILVVLKQYLIMLL